MKKIKTLTQRTAVSLTKSDRSANDNNVVGVYNNNIIKRISKGKKTGHYGFNFNKSTTVTGTLHYFYQGSRFTVVRLTTDHVYCIGQTETVILRWKRFTRAPS